MTIEETLRGLTALQNAAQDFARSENRRIAAAVVAELSSKPPIGTFSETAARHLWDEYCWSIQEGPFDDDISIDHVSFGSLQSGYDDTVAAYIQSHIDALPNHTQVLLSALAIEEDDDYDGRMQVGNLWNDGMVKQVLELLISQASRRQLDLIGPDRGDVIGYEISGSGVVWTALSDRREATELISPHVNEMIDKNGDLSDPAADLVAAFMTAASETVVDNFLADFFDIFENDIRDMLLKDDVLPALEEIRDQLLERLDE